MFLFLAWVLGFITAFNQYRSNVGSLSELINKRGRSVIQIVERMPLTIIINPSAASFERLALFSVLQPLVAFHRGGAKNDSLC
jgi:hypothetical protein